MSKRQQIIPTRSQTVRRVSRFKYLVTDGRKIPMILDFKHRVSFPANRDGNKIGRKYCSL